VLVGQRHFVARLRKVCGSILVTVPY